VSTCKLLEPIGEWVSEMSTLGWLNSQMAGLGPADRVGLSERKCRAMRAQGLAGHWTYDLALHRNLLTVLEAERAALAAMESLPASPWPAATAGRLTPAQTALVGARTPAKA
jgi:hypothetical protein